MESSLAQAARILLGALTPFAKALAGTDEHLLRYVRSLGWILPEVPQALKDLRTGSNLLVASLAKLESELRSDLNSSSGSSETEVELLINLALFTAAIRGLEGGLRAQLPAPFVAATHIDTAITNRIFEDALSQRLEYESRDVYLIARVLGLVDSTLRDADPDRFQPAYEERAIRWDRLPQLVDDPAGLMRDVYGWGTPTLDRNKLFLALRDLSFAFLAPASFDSGARSLLRAMLPELPDTVSSGRGLRFSFFEDTPLAFVVGLYPFPQRQPDEQQGLVLTFGGLANITDSFSIAPSLSLSINSQIDLASGIALAFWPDRPPKIVGNIATTPSTLVEGANATIGVTYAPPGETDRLALLRFSDFQMDIKGLSIQTRFGVTGGTVDASVAASATGLRVQIGGLGQDSFLDKVLPDNLALEFDVGVGWSTAQGLYWQNGTGPSITVPVAVTIGPIELQTIEVSLTLAGDAYQVGLGLSASTHIGPVVVEIAGVGVAASVNLQGGNLGPIDVGFSAKPPSGAGLLIDAAGVTGGGFLKHDPAKHEYAGMLQLQFIDLALQAFGLITTQVAGGAGYSLLALVNAEFPPVQLGWGFTLDGVGGLLAIHRTASTEALHAALKAGQLSSVLFPKNAITNAPVILAQLDALFPTAPGRFLFGPMALIGWGTPRMLKAAIAVVVELPEPVRVILLARIEARLPDETHPLARINMDALGVLDLGKDELSFDAVLFDSKLTGFTLSGAMALRASWARQREFVLAIGGVHPRFTPPAGFPELQRITIDMPSGRISKLRLAAYLAVTSNSIQLGANLDVFVGVSGFGVSGHLGFDALLQRDPFRFDADISGKVAITAGGDDLASVSLDATLTGPSPYHIAGKFKVHIVFFDVHVSFSHTWGEDALVLPKATIDVGSLLRATLADVRNWDAQLPAGTAPLVSARRIEDAGSVLAHPLARPQVQERIVPLGLAITRFGEAVPTGGATFAITGLRIGTGAVPHETIEDDFAPAQFFELSEEEKLERPSFERHDAGVRLKGGLVQTPAAVGKTAAYETFFVDEPGGALRTEPGVAVAPPFLLSDLAVVMHLGAAGRAARRNGSRYQAAGTPIRVAEPAFVLADRSTMAIADPTPAAGTTFSDMHALLAGRRNLQIIATHEMTVN